MEQDVDLGTLVISFFHDHTRFRIPRPSVVLAFAQTNQTIIAQMIEKSELSGLQEHEKTRKERDKDRNDNIDKNMQIFQFHSSDGPEVLTLDEKPPHVPHTSEGLV